MTSYAELLPARRSLKGGALPIAAGAFLLVVRAETLSLGAGRFAALLLIYCALAAVSLTPDRGVAPRGAASAWAVTLVGVVAVAGVARAPWQLSIPSTTRVAALVLGVAAAVAEEAFFRRLLYGWLESHLGAGAAVGGSALAFALVHVPLYGTAALWLDLGAGLLLSWQRWASGSWGPPAIAHAFANVVAGVA